MSKTHVQSQAWQYQEAGQAAKDDISGDIDGMKRWESMPLAGRDEVKCGYLTWRGLWSHQEYPRVQNMRQVDRYKGLECIVWAHRKSTDYDIGKSPVLANGECFVNLFHSVFAHYIGCHSEQADNDLRTWCSWAEWTTLRGPVWTPECKIPSNITA
ncbi:hypothetical protein C8J57DRAFT_1214015 [Mycena rebaudengoi]|nr:hypothetical protein C8J57DRAFT_1214015 [Mycena rebaudengoi]